MDFTGSQTKSSIRDEFESLKIPNFQDLQDDDNQGDENDEFENNNNETEDEGIELYKIGGYHPTFMGEVLNNRYVIIQKLGWGHFSTVWLAKDFKYETYVALKIQRSAPHYQEAAFDEIEILQCIQRKVNNERWVKDLSNYRNLEVKQGQQEDTHLVQLLNVFVHKGPFGDHFVMVFEILGVNFLEVIKKYTYKGIGPVQCQSVVKQVLLGLDYLHRICGIIHTDIKPENILVCLSAEEIKEIVESSQISQSLKQQQRIQHYQQTHGVNLIQNSDNNLQLTKKQKKQQKKKIQRKKKKIQEKTSRQSGLKLCNDDSQNGSIFGNNSLTSQHENLNLFSKRAESIPVQSVLNNNRYSVLKVKIADLGNGCWIHHHFSEVIQTRQYRSPEVILGYHYGPPTDIWSLGCMIFEIITGEFLFDPRKGPKYGKNDDHLAQMIELLGNFPKSFALCGRNSKKYFDKSGTLKRIPQLQFWSLKQVFTDKYKMKEQEAKSLANFLMPMLQIVPEKRMTAKQLLQSPWLNFFQTQDPPRKFTTYVNKKLINFFLKSDTDSSREMSSSQSSEEDSQSEDRRYNRFVDIRCVDKSFTDLGYFGHADGINCDELDQNSTQKW